MLYTINEIRQRIFHPVYDVYDVFLNYFGEDYVDLQNMPPDSEFLEILENLDIVESTEYEHHYEIPDEIMEILAAHYAAEKFTLLVWWPEVTVTNEFDRSIVIQDLFAKVPLNTSGCIPYEYSGFQLTRSTFTETQYSSGYVHSHIPHQDPSSMPRFKDPCLGSGPIRNTILELKNSSDETEWMLFCEELSRYVTVESLFGVPYIKMESIGKSNELPLFKDFISRPSIAFFPNIEMDTLNQFIHYYILHGNFHFSFAESSFQCGLSFYEYIIDVSNSFIEWFNTHGTQEERERLFENKVIISARVDNGKFYKPISSNYSHNPLIGRTVLTFKGRDFPLRIIQSERPEEQISLILDNTIASYICQKIIKIINYRYGNNTNSAETSATTHQAVCYI